MRRFAKHTLIIEIMGWYGMVAVLVAYGVVNLDILPSHNIWCVLLNLTGSIGLLMAAAIKRADQLVVLNTVWALVAVIALIEVSVR